MAAIDFPPSPVDQQEYTNPATGVVYTYTLAKDLWTGEVQCDVPVPLAIDKPIINNKTRATEKSRRRPINLLIDGLLGSFLFIRISAQNKL